MTNTILLALIAASLLWGLVLRDPVTTWRRMRAQRRRVLSGAVPTADAVTFDAPAPEPTSMQFLLCDSKGHVEHEIAFHGTDAPETYSYGGKTYQQEKRRHGKDAVESDVIWEYRR
jgi:hypothetical protein